MIDLCPRCRIQAPHRPGRERCPRCGGPLSVVDDAARALREAERNRDLVGARAASAPRAVPPQAPPTGRIFRAPHVRWVARRPPEAIPVRRRASRPPGPRRIPRYTYIPTWGFHDEPAAAAQGQSRTDQARSRLLFALVMTGSALVASAVIHLFRYILLALNRSTPLPEWLIALSDWLVLFIGVLALLGFVASTWFFTRWVLDLRASAHRDAHLLDPRRPVWVALLTAVPLVNLVGAPLILGEVAALRVAHDRDLDAERVRGRLRRMWVAWAIVNAVAIAAVVARVVAWRSDSVQTGANALTMVIVSSAVSAAFAFWMARRVPALFDASSAPVPTKRWVAVA
ncbi:DUF4328 domain-containing protein [Gordonia aurantiaca]|uniref:DUF4328 domain-containing protein n=1 Tax=Gordonia sp. B21 TaxID=3151852 RepID=UPI003265273E